MLLLLGRGAAYAAIAFVLASFVLNVVCALKIFWNKGKAEEEVHKEDEGDDDDAPRHSASRMTKV